MSANPSVQQPASACQFSDAIYGVYSSAVAITTKVFDLVVVSPPDTSA